MTYMINVEDKHCLGYDVVHYDNLTMIRHDKLMYVGHI